MSTKRVFRSEDPDDPKFLEAIVPEATSLNLGIKHAVQDLVKRAYYEGWCLRDVQLLVSGTLDIEISKAILLRRKDRNGGSW